jgi:hypothetical protein
LVAALVLVFTFLAAEWWAVFLATTFLVLWAAAFLVLWRALLLLVRCVVLLVWAAFFVWLGVL